MILTPSSAPFLTLWLCSLIHQRASLLTCQGTLSQIRSHTFLPLAWSLPEHQERNRVVIPLTGRPSTKRILFELRHIEPVAGDGLRVGIVFDDRVLDEAQGLALFAEAVQGGQSHPAPPALILVADGPSVGVVVGQLDQSVAHPFYFHTLGRER